MEPTLLARSRVPASAAHLARYAGKRISFFSPSFFRLFGSATHSGAFAAFGRKAPCSSEHPGSLQHSGVAFVERGFFGRRRVVASPNVASGRFEPHSPVVGSCDVRAAWVVRQVALSWAFRSCRGSIDGPYNIRLHLTAPRERCSHSVRGESPVIEYHPGARAHPIASVRLAVGCEPAFHRKPCDSPRPERTRDAAGEPERYGSTGQCRAA